MNDFFGPLIRKRTVVQKTDDPVHDTLLTAIRRLQDSFYHTASSNKFPSASRQSQALDVVQRRLMPLLTDFKNAYPNEYTQLVAEPALASILHRPLADPQDRRADRPQISLEQNLEHIERNSND